MSVYLEVIGKKNLILLKDFVTLTKNVSLVVSISVTGCSLMFYSCLCFHVIDRIRTWPAPVATMSLFCILTTARGRAKRWRISLKPGYCEIYLNVVCVKYLDMKNLHIVSHKDVGYWVPWRLEKQKKKALLWMSSW